MMSFLWQSGPPGDPSCSLDYAIDTAKSLLLKKFLYLEGLFGVLGLKKYHRGLLYALGDI